MMWSKVQTMSIGEFMGQGAALGTAPPPSIIDWFMHPILTTKEVGAEGIYDFIEPFLEMLTILSQPIANILLIVGGLLFIVGFKDKCVKWMTITSLVFVTIQLLPMLLKICLQMMATV
jgi:hypothetical protein